MRQLQNFINQSQPPIVASWLNWVDLVTSQMYTNAAGNLLGLPLTAVVAQSESRTNTATLTNSAYLSGPLLPGTWEIFLLLPFTALSGGLACNINFTGTQAFSGVTLWGAYGQNSNTGQVYPSVGAVATSVGTTEFTVAGGTNSSLQFIQATGLLVATSTGTLSFAFAQATAAPATTTTLTAGAYVKLTQMA